MEYIKTFESYIKTYTAVIEILKPYAWMNLDKYIQAVPYHLTKERLIFIHLGHGERRNISTKNIKVLAVFDNDMYDKEFIKKYIKDRQDEKKLNENINGFVNLQRCQIGDVNDIWDFNIVNGQHGQGIYAFKAGDSAMKSYYSKNGENVHSFKVLKKYVLDISNKNYDYWEARKIIFENPEYKVFLFKHKGIGIPTSKEYLITDPNVIILDEKVSSLNESFDIVLENPFIEGLPSIEKVKYIQKWINDNNNKYDHKYVKFYHGTDKTINVLEEGLLPTSYKRRRSYQSTSGYVYLANTPERAREFGERGNPYGCNVYEVAVLVRDLKADTDQLNNMRSTGHYDFIKDTVAYSMTYGGGVRIKGKIEPWQIKLYSKS